jgi:cob(I)alamin adenosyltransferase
MSFYTKKGDDGTTGLYYGGRVRKDADAPEAYGAVDEAQAFLGLARAEAERGSELDQLLLRIERDLYVLMAELATLPENRHKLSGGATLVTEEMVAFVGERTDDLSARFTMPDEFVLPGENRTSALLEVARTVIRRAERRAISVAAPESSVVPYLNRLSSLLWAMARWQEGGAVPAKLPSPPS